MLTNDYLARMEAELLEEQMMEEWEQWECCVIIPFPDYDLAA